MNNKISFNNVGKTPPAQPQKSQNILAEITEIEDSFEMSPKAKATSYLQKRFPLGDPCNKLEKLATQGYVIFGEDTLDTRCIKNGKPAILYFYYSPEFDERKVQNFTKKEILTYLGNIIEQYTETNPEKGDICKTLLAEFEKKLNNEFPNKD